MKVCMIHLLHLCDYNEEVLKNKRKRCFKYEICWRMTTAMHNRLVSHKLTNTND